MDGQRNVKIDFHSIHLWFKYACKGKGKGHPRTDNEGPQGEKKYSSTLSLTSALVGVGGQFHAMAALPSEKNRHQLYGRLGGPQGLSGRMRKICPLPPTVFDHRTVEPLTSRYNGWAIPARPGPARPVWTGAENLAPTGIWSPDLPARSQLLYWLS
jgi:hypothetical protein